MSSNRPKNPQNSGNRPEKRARDTAPPARPSNVRVRPVRPQSGPPPGGGPPTNLVPILVGGGFILLAVIVLATLLLNNGTGGATPTPTAAAGIPTVPLGAAGLPTTNPATIPPAAGGTQAPVAAGAPAGGDSTAVVETSKGTFKIKLFTDDPVVKGTVENFRNKAVSGYFNGKTFHRVEDWVIQGGDPLGNGTGGGDIPGEYSAQHSFTRGAVGMASHGAHADVVNDSQWFVVKKDSTFLDNNYAIFGQVIEGMDVVEKIAIGDTMTKITMQP